MRLRNKNTGEVVRFYDGISLNGEDYDSLAELNEEWEDVKAPLFEDEKVRKVVQAWAKLNNIGSVVILDAKSHLIVRSRIGISYDLELNYDCKAGLKNIEFGKPYAIEELCGEEEE